MSGTRLLSTVLLDQLLIDKAAKEDIVLDAMSFIQLTSNTEDDLWAEVEEMCSLPITAVFTSANAVRAIAHIVADVKPEWNIYCIGNATRTAVLECFKAQAIRGTANDAAELAGQILNDGVCEVVFFCGDMRMDTLPVLLRNDDITVHEVIVYHTIETPHEVTKHYDGILFFSPSGVNSFFSVNKVDATTVLFAIGHTTAEAVKMHTTNTIVTGETHSKEGLVESAIQYFHKRAHVTT
jgi:uroporphyrinogen-III synthase